LDYLAACLEFVVAKKQCFSSGETGRSKKQAVVTFLSLHGAHNRGMFRLRAICWPKSLRIKIQEFSSIGDTG
jgi:hypothetical protein